MQGIVGCSTGESRVSTRAEGGTEGQEVVGGKGTKQKKCLNNLNSLEAQHSPTSQLR